MEVLEYILSLLSKKSDNFAQMETKKASIELHNLSIGYGKKVVASGIAASIQEGELTCLLGANGVGKSTLMRTLVGFQPSLGGDVLLQGKPLTAHSRAELSRTVSVVLTEKPDVQNFSVRMMVGMGRAPYTGFWGKLSNEDLAVVEQAIEMVGIEKLSDRMMSTLSDGERQKVMIAKALAQQTPVVVLDEPTAFLDYNSKVEVLLLLQRICREMNKTVFLSTHDVEMALQIADRLWLMGADGITTGTTKTLADSGKLQQFFGSDNLMFDNETRLFRVVNEKGRD